MWPLDCSAPGFPVLHCLPEFAQTMKNGENNRLATHFLVLGRWKRTSVRYTKSRALISAHPRVSSAGRGAPSFLRGSDAGGPKGHPKATPELPPAPLLCVQPHGEGGFDFPGSSDGKVSACNAGDPGSIPGSGRSPGEGSGSDQDHPQEKKNAKGKMVV